MLDATILVIALDSLRILEVEHSERDWHHVQTSRYDRGRRYSSEYRRPQHHDLYSPG